MVSDKKVKQKEKKIKEKEQQEKRRRRQAKVLDESASAAGSSAKVRKASMKLSLLVFERDSGSFRAFLFPMRFFFSLCSSTWRRTNVTTQF